MEWWAILLIVIGALIVALIVFVFFYGRKLQKKQNEAEKQMELQKQTVSMLIIDKKLKKMKESGLPAAAIEQTPKYMRGMKVPVVKAKIGSRIMVLLADKKVFDIIPVQKTCLVSLSGIYITEIKSVRGGSVPRLPEKKNFAKRLSEKLSKRKA